MSKHMPEIIFGSIDHKQFPKTGTDQGTWHAETEFREFKPENNAYQCQYVRADLYVDLKTRYLEAATRLERLESRLVE